MSNSKSPSVAGSGTGSKSPSPRHANVVAGVCTSPRHVVTPSPFSCNESSKDVALSVVKSVFDQSSPFPAPEQAKAPKGLDEVAAKAAPVSADGDGDLAAQLNNLNRSGSPLPLPTSASLPAMYEQSHAQSLTAANLAQVDGHANKSQF